MELIMKMLEIMPMAGGIEWKVVYISRGDT